MNDKQLGYLTASVATALGIVYLIGLRYYPVWAIRVPVIAMTYLLFGIMFWIGYTMITTPPPIPLTTPIDLDAVVPDEKEKSDTLAYMRSNEYAMKHKRILEEEEG